MRSWFPDYRSRRLALKFAIRILLFSSVLAAIITVVELAMEYHEDVSAIDQRTQQIELSHLDSVVENVWVMDRERLDTQLHGIVRLPDVVLAQVRVGDTILMGHGSALQGPGITREFQLRRAHRGTMQDLGVLVVSSSYRSAYGRVVEHLLFRLIANAFKALLVGAFIFVLFFRLIGRHLDRIGEYATEITPQAKKTRLSLDRPDPAEDDELTRLVRAINGPREQLLALLELEQQRSDVYEKQATLLRQELLARKKIQRELDLMARVFEGSIDAIMLTDSENRVAAVNGAFCRLTGYDRNEVLGEDPRILGCIEADKEVFRAMWASLDRTSFWEGEVCNRRKDGSLLQSRLLVTAVRDREDQVTNYIGVFPIPRVSSGA